MRYFIYISDNYKSLIFFGVLQNKAANSDVTVVCFLIFPTQTSNFNVESLRGQAIAKQLRETVSNLQNELGKRIYELCLK